MSLEDSIERVRSALIEKMGNKSYLRPAGLVEALAGDTKESAITVRQAMGRLTKEGWLDGVGRDGTPLGQVHIIGTLPVKPIDPDAQRWLAVLEASGVTEKDRKALAPLSAKLVDFDTPEMKHILKGLTRLRENLAGERGHHLFLVSAKYLIGSSKLLGMLAGPALRTFGIPVDGFSTHPPYVVVGGSTQPETVVLVENPAAFELAMATGAAQRCAFIATYGFGLSKTDNEYGNQLAELVKYGFSGAITLIREGSSCPPVRELFSHPRITFWGDLDLAGMQIFERIAAKIPRIQLSALYGPMLEAIKDTECRHPYAVATGKPRQKPYRSNRQDVQQILSLCERYAVDQEIVSPEKIELLASHVLDVSAFGL
ncbi:MAG: hypothetical protein KGZ83_01590 [Sulfuricella sp.]|nr:hypothetical protein [Sulfuricella sp.]